MYIILALIGLSVLSSVLFMNLPRFGKLPSGERMKKIEMSPNYRNGEFRNQSLTPQLTSDKSRLRTMSDFLFEKRKGNRPTEAVAAQKNDLKNLPPDKNLVVWFGHSSYFMQIDGKRLLVDPVFYDASPVSFFNRPFIGTDIYKAEDMPEIDYLIITHDHWDHLDHKAISKLKEKISKVVCPLGVGEHFEYWGYDSDKLVELDWSEQFELGHNYNIHCLPARHFSGRSFRANQTLWASFMLSTPTQTLYISGDGGYDYHFKDIARQFPTIDLALMENGQYNLDWRFIHLMPTDLVAAIKELNPLSVITGHNSKYALAKHPWNEPMDKIAAAATTNSIALLTPVIGEVVYLKSKLPL